MPDIAPVLDRIDVDLDGALERLFGLLRCKSISTDPAFKSDCQQAAEILAADLSGIGFDARVAPTAGHPMVVGHDHSGDGPHILFYGHYDVQPVDPLELWDGDPFAPEIRTRDNGTKYLFGRGTSDDKGQLMTFVEACRAWKAVHGTLPCKVTILIEGEEESGGGNLPPFLDAHKDELTAEIALVCDTNMWNPETPAITTMLRGMCGDEVIVHAASRDLHSGHYGGAAANPITVLARILGDLHDETGRIQVPDFYDGVPNIPNSLRAQWDALGFDHKAFLGEVGLAKPFGEQDKTAIDQVWARPTAEVNGIIGGYTGAGFKTVIPAQASAKISFRLVGDQDPHAIRKNFRAFVEARLPEDCRADFIEHGSGQASMASLDDPAFETARQALSAEWGTEAAFIGAGGSIPVVEDFKGKLGMDTMLIGFALDDDNIHSPNEKYELRSFHKGIRSFARILGALGN